MLAWQCLGIPDFRMHPDSGTQEHWLRCWTLSKSAKPSMQVETAESLLPDLEEWQAAFDTRADQLQQHVELDDF